MAPLPRPYVPSPGANPAAAARVKADVKGMTGIPDRLPGNKTAGLKPKTPQNPAPKPQDPYADPQAYIRDAVAQLGTPMSDQQIQANAQSQLAPLIAALQASIRAQALSGTNAIQGYTSNLAQHLAGYQQNAQNIYGGAEQAQAASDAALASRLTGGGDQQAQELGAKLASINAPGAVNQAVQGASQTALGSGNALYATGGASLANLIASGAAEQSYAGKLSGIAGLAGAQQVGSLQGELAKSLADQTGSLQAKVPDIVSGLEGQRSDLLNRQATLTGNLNSFFSDRGFKQKAIDQEAQALGLNKSKAKTAAAVAGARIGISAQNANTAAARAKAAASVSQQNANTSAKNAQTSAQRAANAQANANRAYNLAVKKLNKAQQPKANSSLSKAYGYLVDSAGNPILRKGQRQTLPATAASSAKKTVSAGEAQRWDAEALGLARIGHKATAGGHPPVTWQVYLDTGLAKGIPAARLVKQGKKVYSQAEIHQGLVPGSKK